MQIDTSEETWDPIFHHDLTDANSSDPDLYFDRLNESNSVLSKNTEFKDAQTGDLISSALYSLVNSEYRNPDDGSYMFKLVYPRSLFQREAIEWKQTNNPLDKGPITGFQLLRCGLPGDLPSITKTDICTMTLSCVFSEFEAALKAHETTKELTKKQVATLIVKTSIENFAFQFSEYLTITLISMTNETANDDSNLDNVIIKYKLQSYAESDVTYGQLFITSKVSTSISIAGFDLTLVSNAEGTRTTVTIFKTDICTMTLWCVFSDFEAALKAHKTTRKLTKQQVAALIVKTIIESSANQYSSLTITGISMTNEASEMAGLDNVIIQYKLQSYDTDEVSPAQGVISGIASGYGRISIAGFTLTVGSDSPGTVTPISGTTTTSNGALFKSGACAQFQGLQRINDDISLLGTDPTQTDIFRIGQFQPYLVTERVPMVYWNDSDSNKTAEVQMGGIIGFKPTVDHDVPRHSFQAVALYVRDQKQCLDWDQQCYQYAVDMYSDSTKTCGNPDIARKCRQSCKECKGRSRTDLYTFNFGPSTLATVSAIVEYKRPFHRIPHIDNVWIHFANSEYTLNDTGVLLYTEFDTEGSRLGMMIFVHLEITEMTKYSGWKDDVTVYWHVHEKWTPSCTYHSDEVCAELNRLPCTEGWYDNTCMQCKEVCYFESLQENIHSKRNPDVEKKNKRQHRL